MNPPQSIYLRHRFAPIPFLPDVVFNLPAVGLPDAWISLVRFPRLSGASRTKHIAVADRLVSVSPVPQNANDVTHREP